MLAIADELTENGFVLRYRTDETDDGLSGKEGTFLICSFWLVSALSIVGEAQRAHDLMERLLRVASPLGLYAEEFDADTGRHLGQLPAGVLAPGADRGRGADHPRRAARAGGARARRARAALAAVDPHQPIGGRAMGHYDVIIIGTGAGGGTLARHLAPSGKRVLLLERGGWLPREPQNVSAEEVFVNGRYVSPDTWRYENGEAFQPQVHYFVGGATKMYGAALYRLRAEDFGELRHHDGISPAWPIGYDAMEPYYTLAEQLLPGARRARRGSDRAAGAARRIRSRRYRTSRASRSSPTTWRKIGHHPFHAPCGVMLDEGNMPFSACMRCDNCDGFPCIVHAKSDAEVLGVRPALEHANVELWIDVRGGAPEHQRRRDRGHRRRRQARRRRGDA